MGVVGFEPTQPKHQIYSLAQLSPDNYRDWRTPLESMAGIELAIRGFARLPKSCTADRQTSALPFGYMLICGGRGNPSLLLAGNLRSRYTQQLLPWAYL